MLMPLLVPAAIVVFLGLIFLMTGIEYLFGPPAPKKRTRQNDQH